jgi:putative transposase
MKQARYSEEQIVYTLKQVDAGGRPAKSVGSWGERADLLYLEAEVRWGGRFRSQGAEENRKLKQLVADLTLDKHILQEVLSKKV